MRFVSEQKRRQEEAQFEAAATAADFAQSTIVADTVQFSNPPRRSDQVSSLENCTSSEYVDKPQSSEAYTMEDLSNDLDESLGTEKWDLWLGQYNRNRIAQELVSLDADVEAAMKAGETIQSYVLTRTARRRIRIFLRERETLWKNSDNDLSLVEQQLILSKVTRTRASPPQYGFGDIVQVMLEYGLTGKDICTILTHSPSVAMMIPRRSFMQTDERNFLDIEDGDNDTQSDTLEDTLQRSFVTLLQEDLRLRKYDARKIVRSCPGLLSIRGSNAAVQNVNMMTKLGATKNSIARDKTNLPVLLSRSPAAVFRLVSFLSCDKVRMPIQSIGPLLRRSKGRELLDIVAPAMSHQQTLDVDSEGDEKLGPYEASESLVRSREESAQRINDMYRNMTATAQILRFEIGAHDLGKLISADPSVLLLNAKEHILPVASFLADELGIWEDTISELLQQYPMLLEKDVAEMERVVSFLKYLGVEDDDLPSIIRAFPALLAMDIETQMTPVVEFLIEIGVSNVGAFITRLPPVLGYSVDRELRPKWDYLSTVCLRPTFEINNFPAYFSYPFDRVIRTRYEYLEVKGIARQLMSVDAVLRFGDADFCINIARDEDDGRKFRAFADSRLKRSTFTNGGKKRGKSSRGSNNGPISHKKKNPQ